MAQPANTFDTYDDNSAREDLYDTIYNVDPDETPFLSAIAKVKASNVYHEWQTDVLDTPADDNAHVQGGDISGEAITPTVRVGNRTQIFQKSVTISGTLEATDRAGQGRAATYQKLMKGKALKNDMEKSAFANQAQVAGSGTVAPRLAGVPTWLATNTNAGSGGSDPTGDGTDARTDGTQEAFTEARFKAVLRSIADNSSEKPDCVWANSFNREVASGFVGMSTRFDKGEDSKVTATVKLYEYDFGDVRFEFCRHVRTRDVIITPTKMWAWAELRPMFDKPLATTGDAEKFAIIAEATLVSRNEAASGGVFDNTTS